MPKKIRIAPESEKPFRKAAAEQQLRESIGKSFVRPVRGFVSSDDGTDTGSTSAFDATGIANTIWVRINSDGYDETRWAYIDWSKNNDRYLFGAAIKLIPYWDDPTKLEVEGYDTGYSGIQFGSDPGFGGTLGISSVIFTATPTSVFGVTGSGTTTIALSLDSQNANLVFAGPSSGGAATPDFRTLVEADVSSAAAVRGLSNLASVAINTSLISDTDNTDDLGSSAIKWRASYTNALYLEERTAPATPSTGDAVLYAKTDGLYYKKDDGTEIGPLDASGASITLPLAVDEGGTGADLSLEPDGYLRRTGSAVMIVTKCNFSSSVAPSIGDDLGAGYSVGSMWYDTTADKFYVCLDASASAAQWKNFVPNNADILPDVDNSRKLGSSALKWEDVFTYELLLEERTAPATPAAGDLSVYAKATGLYYMDDAGTEVGPLGAGTVTSVALSASPSGIFDVSGSPVTTSGTLALAMDNQSANTVLAGPTSGGAAQPSFRALDALDLPLDVTFNNVSIFDTLSFRDYQSVTISTGAITAAASVIYIDTEAAAATDDLQTITPDFSKHDVIYITPANDARTVVLVTGGNIVFPPGTSTLTLDNTNEFVTLIYSDVDSKWHIVGVNIDAVSSAGANTSLSNLTGVAINTSLVSDTDNLDDLGSTSVMWREGFMTYLTLGEAVAHGTPATGRVALYVKTDGKLYYKDDAGAETGPLAGAAGVAATAALNNLSGVAINTTLVSDTDNTDDLGSSSVKWRAAYTNALYLEERTAPATPSTGDAVVYAKTTGLFFMGDDGVEIGPLVVGANTTLSNLGTTLINTTLKSDTDNTDDLGTTSVKWANTFTNALVLEERSAPSTPASGDGVLYAKTDGLYYKGDDGVEVGFLVGKGSGTDARLRATVNTTDATATTLITASSTTNQSVVIDGVIYGRKSDYTVKLTARFEGHWTRDAGNINQGTGTVTVAENSASAPTVALARDTGTNTALVQVTGVAAETWNWLALYTVTTY